MPPDALIVFCTCPDQSCAEAVAERLVDDGLAACVTISGPVTSIYQWQGKRETAEEVQLFIKSSRARYPALEQAILSLHPYELPEIIAVAVEQGLAGYLRWIGQCTRQNG
jgi:periplasmic divalent cation tolerance protein